MAISSQQVRFNLRSQDAELSKTLKQSDTINPNLFKTCKLVMERLSDDSNTEYHNYEFKRYGNRPVNRIKQFICRTTYIFTFAWCRCSPIAFLSVRHLQVTIFSLMMSVVAMTSNIRIIVLMMTDVYLEEGFDWNRRHQVFAHTMFFFGNMFMNFGSHMVAKYLGKSTVCCSLFLACLINACTPILIGQGQWTALLLSRFLVGMLIGLLTELLYIALTKWCTKKSKMRMFCMALSGVNLGHAIMLTVVCSLYDSDRFLWGLYFYFMASYGMLILIIWMLLGSTDPQYCPYLSFGERKYLQEDSLDTDDLDVYFVDIPWKMIFSNVPFYALVIAEFCYRMAFWFNIAQMPLFFAEVYGYPFWKVMAKYHHRKRYVINASTVLHCNHVLLLGEWTRLQFKNARKRDFPIFLSHFSTDFDNQVAGMMSALPHVVVWFSCYPVTEMIGLFIRARIVHLTAARKWCNLLALCAGSVSYFSLLGSQSLLGSVTSYTSIVTLEMYHMMGVSINHIDLSPRYSGVLLGIIRCFSNLAAILSAVLVMWLVTDLEELDDWDPAFILIGTVSMLGGIIFFFFGDAEIQAFNYYPP